MAQPVAVQLSTDRGGSVSMESEILPRVSRGTSRHGRAESESGSAARSCLTKTNDFVMWRHVLSVQTHILAKATRMLELNAQHQVLYASTSSVAGHCKCVEPLSGVDT